MGAVVQHLEFVCPAHECFDEIRRAQAFFDGRAAQAELKIRDRFAILALAFGPVLVILLVAVDADYTAGKEERCEREGKQAAGLVHGCGLLFGNRGSFHGSTERAQRAHRSNRSPCRKVLTRSQGHHDVGEATRGRHVFRSPSVTRSTRAIRTALQQPGNGGQMPLPRRVHERIKASIVRGVNIGPRREQAPDGAVVASARGVVQRPPALAHGRIGICPALDQTLYQAIVALPRRSIQSAATLRGDRRCIGTCIQQRTGNVEVVMIRREDERGVAAFIA